MVQMFVHLIAINIFKVKHASVNVIHNIIMQIHKHKKIFVLKVVKNQTFTINNIQHNYMSVKIHVVTNIQNHKAYYNVFQVVQAIHISLQVAKKYVNIHNKNVLFIVYRVIYMYALINAKKQLNIQKINYVKKIVHNQIHI